MLVDRRRHRRRDDCSARAESARQSLRNARPARGSLQRAVSVDVARRAQKLPIHTTTPSEVAAPTEGMGCDGQSGLRRFVC
jgi:hypothetical protein